MPKLTNEQRAARAAQVQLCATCGVGFNPRHNRHKYCSRICKESSDEKRVAHMLYMREYREDPVNREKHNGFSRAWHRKTLPTRRVQARVGHLRRTFGLTPEQFGEMMLRQGGSCATCDRPPKRDVLNVDHNHETGEIRGLLCDRCNTFIGYLEKAPELVETWQAYIKLYSMDAPIYA